MVVSGYNQKQADSFKHATNIHENIEFRERDKTLLRDYNLDEKIVAEYCSSVEVECMNHVIHGIAIRNMHNGIEFFNDSECKQPKTIGLSGLVIIVNSLQLYNRSCVLFENCMDLLAFLTLKKHKLLGKYSKLPSTYDYIVLNNAANFRFLLKKIEEYNNIYSFFSNTILGDTLGMSIDSICIRNYEDCSKLYSRCTTITDYLRLHKGTL